VRVYEATSDYAEAQWLVERCPAAAPRRLAAQRDRVLYRSNAQSRVIESALFNAGVPYRVYGGLRFFERAEIKHALAYLRLLENPNDDTSFLRVVNFPPRGIGARSIEQLQDAARASGRSLLQSVGAVPGKAGPTCRAFVALIDVLREADQGPDAARDHRARAGAQRPDRLLQAPRRKAQDRIENLEELVNAAESFVTQEGFGRTRWRCRWTSSQSPSQGLDPSRPLAAAPDGVPDADTGEILSPLAAFLTHAALEAGDNQAQAGQDAVQLMTVHSAKGLEFDCVFITGMEEGLFPHENSPERPDGLEEERRLMYVAITRARKRLYLSLRRPACCTARRATTSRAASSTNCPRGCLKWITPAPGYESVSQQVW
jgi:DNA helicase-2/ATP-dependent DNA helicase PcrA